VKRVAWWPKRLGSKLSRLCSCYLKPLRNLRDLKRIAQLKRQRKFLELQLLDKCFILLELQSKLASRSYRQRSLDMVHLT